MPFTVTLSRTTWPTYPDMCIRCGRPHPSEMLDPVSQWLIKPDVSEFAGHPITAPQPHCSFCKRVTPIERWVRHGLLATSILLVLVGIATLKDSETGPVRHTEYAFFVCGTLVCFAVWAVIPPPLRITARRSKLRYRFRKANVGKAFKEANARRCEATLA